MGITTASLIVPRICVALWHTLHGECFPALTEQHWHEIAQDFNDRTNFPHCIDAVDGQALQNNRAGT